MSNLPTPVLDYSIFANQYVLSANISLRYLRETLFSGKYRTNFINSRDKLENDLAGCERSVIIANERVEFMLHSAREYHTLPAIMDEIEALNQAILLSYNEVMRVSPNRALMAARLEDTIEITNKIRALLKEVSDILEKEQNANILGGGSRKRRTQHKRTHRKRTHHKRTQRKRTQRKHRTHRK
jgi:hypothetical protein